MNRAEILIIDDEPQMRKLLEITLQSHGYLPRMAATAKEGLIMAGNHPPALVLLDLGLPDDSGHAVLQKLREWYTAPVIILSVQKAEEAIIKALDNGANDYLSKPFRPGELLARIRTALRREQAGEGETVFQSGHLKVDLGTRSVWKEDQLVKLTSTEYNLLALLIRNDGKVLTHEHLLKTVWGPDYSGQSQYLRVFMAQIRKKIEANPNRPQFIKTEAGVGYRFMSQ